MGSIYRPKYRNAAGELVESSVYWMRYRVNGQVRRESTHKANERAAIGVLRVKEGDAVRGIATPPKVNRKTVDEILSAVAQDYAINGKRTLKKVEDRIRLLACLRPSQRGEPQ